jgi:hypothetical protein
MFQKKARLFAAAFGMTADDAEALREIVLQIVKTQGARLGRRDEYGQRYNENSENEMAPV